MRQFAKYTFAFSAGMMFSALYMRRAIEKDQMMDEGILNILNGK